MNFREYLGEAEKIYLVKFTRSQLTDEFVSNWIETLNNNDIEVISLGVYNTNILKVKLIKGSALSLKGAWMVQSIQKYPNN